MTYLVCNVCGRPLKQHNGLSDNCSLSYGTEQGIPFFKNVSALQPAEERIRDMQSGTYLAHTKIDSQTKFIRRFINSLDTAHRDSAIVLDLGCGPGPTVSLLREAGYTQITAIDFSADSLLINKRSNPADTIDWLSADLLTLKAVPDAVDLLLMSDFIQHVGTYTDKLQLLQNAIEALKSGGSFFISFFNFNIVNFLKGDLRGNFENGAIQYERLLAKEMLQLIAKSVVIKRHYAMNITHNYQIDNWLGRLPGAAFIGRMYAIEGIRKPHTR